MSRLLDAPPSNPAGTNDTQQITTTGLSPVQEARDGDGASNSLKGLGYRQRGILNVLRNHPGPVPFGYLTRVAGDDGPSNYNNTNVALRALVRRGLIQRTQTGWYEAA